MIAFRGLHKNLWNALEATGRKLGIAKDDPRRLAGAVEHVLYERLSDGHTACPVSECINLVSRTLDDRSIAKHAIQCALDRKAICTTEIDGVKLIQPLGAAIIEGQLESRIRHCSPVSYRFFQKAPN